MTAREIVANLSGIVLIIGEKYDVIYVKMTKIIHKYHAFPSEHFFFNFVQFKGYTIPILFFF